MLGEIEAAPNVTTWRYVQSEVFLSVIVSKARIERDQRRPLHLLSLPWVANSWLPDCFRV